MSLGIGKMNNNLGFFNIFIEVDRFLLKDIK